MDDTQAAAIVLAQDLYTGWVVNQHRDGIAPPRWFALHDDLKMHWFRAAESLLVAYADFHAHADPPSTLRP